MGKLFVVGIGPGGPDGMTIAARRALEAADIVVGYTKYVELALAAVPDAAHLATPMMHEVERCRLALSRAQSGEAVALVCSGDAGVYGMASPVLELAEDYPDVDVEVIAGATAAQSGSAVLGAPLAHDFAVVSLSDLLTPWEVIEKRLACAAAGATVCHVDASKGIVAWGKDNAVASGMADRPIRWLVDDCAKFVAREKRRGNTYDGIIMDPPSYGRGPGGEIWKLEDCIYDLISQCEEVLSDKPLFFAVNSYTTGLSPAVMEYMLKTTLVPRFGGKTSCDEIGLPVSATGGVVPCGATAIWEE